MAAVYCKNFGDFHVYRALHLFSGIGGGSLGFKQARFNWRGVVGRFENVLAIDSDPGACESYRKITGGGIECWDLFSRDQYRRFHGCEPPEGWREITPADISEACNGVAPDVVFTSPPCKGLSGLLPQASAKLDRYQALNELTLRGIKLLLDAFRDQPAKVFLLENVPRIKSRGKHLLKNIVVLLQSAGYAVDLRDHDCGELGGLGQRRKRFLLIARHQKSIKPFIYQPASQPLKTIGDIIGHLPMPDCAESGPMHRLPRLKWLTWLRLALIPAGGDWRDLQKISPDEYRIFCEPAWGTTGGPYSVQDWQRPGATVTGNCRITGSSPACVADPRVKSDARSGYQQVAPWGETAGTVTAASRVSKSNGVAVIADPRLNHEPRPGVYRVLDINETSGAVTGGAGVGLSNGPQAIADPRLHKNKSNYNGSPGLYGVNSWDGQMPAVTGMARVSCSNTPTAIADPRLPESKGVYTNRYRVVRWNSHAPTVTGDTDIQCGAPSIEDPRLGCEPYAGSYGVQGWNKTSLTVSGSMDLHAGAAAISDPRIPDQNDRPDPPPVIIALDDTWHRPLTTLELAALQSFPVRLEDGSPLVLAGKSDSKWREWIGNAVPPAAARAIAASIGTALLQADAEETFVLGMTDIWVRPQVGKSDEIRAIKNQFYAKT